MPARAADTGNGQLGRRQATDPPARPRRRRQSQGIVLLSAPALQHQRQRSALFGGELEPASGSHLRPSHFADHRSEAAVAQPLFHYGEHILIAAAFGVEQTLRRQPHLGKRRSKEITAPQRPEYCSVGSRPPCGQGRKEEAGGSFIGKTRMHSDTFVKRGKGKTGAFEPPVDRRETEGQMSLIAAHSLGLDRAHGNAQGGDALVPDLRRSRHNESTHLFMLCSNTPRRESTAARSRVTIAAIGFGP